MRPRRTRADRQKLPGLVAEQGLDVDILVNNAGFTTVGDVHANPDRQLGMVRVNVEALVDLTTMWLPGMVERGRGAVIQVASTAAFQPMPVQATYGATKAFVLSFSEATSAELKGTGVTMTALCPGPVTTEFVEAGGFKDESPGPSFVYSSADDVAKAGHRGRREGQARRDPGHRQPRRTQLRAATARGRSCSARSRARTAGRSASRRWGFGRRCWCPWSAPR